LEAKTPALPLAGKLLGFCGFSDKAEEVVLGME
jgi:hypothetical protein